MIRYKILDQGDLEKYRKHRFNSISFNRTDEGVRVSHVTYFSRQGIIGFDITPEIESLCNAIQMQYMNYHDINRDNSDASDVSDASDESDVFNNGVSEEFSHDESNNQSDGYLDLIHPIYEDLIPTKYNRVYNQATIKSIVFDCGAMMVHTPHPIKFVLTSENRHADYNILLSASIINRKISYNLSIQVMFTPLCISIPFEQINPKNLSKYCSYGSDKCLLRLIQILDVCQQEVTTNEGKFTFSAKLVDRNILMRSINQYPLQCIVYDNTDIIGTF